MNTLEEFCALVLETQTVKGERKPHAASPRDPLSPPSETQEPEEQTDGGAGSMYLDSTLVEVPTAIFPPTTSEAPLSLPYDALATMEIESAAEEDEEGSCVPSLCLSESESSLYSAEDLSEVSSTDSSNCSLNNHNTHHRCRRRLTFKPTVQVREFSLTHGDHPCCTGSLPIALDWSHAPDYDKDLAQSRDRGLHYLPPPRLTLDKRFTRLLECSVDMDEDELNALIGDRERSYLRQGQRLIVGLLQRSFFSALALSQEVAEEYEQQEQQDGEDAVCSFEEWDAAAPLVDNKNNSTSTSTSSSPATSLYRAEPFCI